MVAWTGFRAWVAETLQMARHFTFVFTGQWWLTFDQTLRQGFSFQVGYPPLARSKCLGPGELRRPTGVDWLWLIVVRGYPECFGYVCTPEISAQFSACCDSRAVPTPLFFPLAAGGDCSSLPACK